MSLPGLGEFEVEGLDWPGAKNKKDNKKLRIDLVIDKKEKLKYVMRCDVNGKPSKGGGYWKVESRFGEKDNKQKTSNCPKCIKLESSTRKRSGAR